VSGGSDGYCSGYLPFGDGGTCTGVGASWSKPGYAGTWTDTETGLDKTDTRFLSAIQGRFLTPDPSRSGWNPYVYAENDPIANTDPSGLYPGAGGGCGAASVSGFGICDGSTDPSDSLIFCGGIVVFGNCLPSPNLPNVFPSFTPDSIAIGSMSVPGSPDGGKGGCAMCEGFTADDPDMFKEAWIGWAQHPGGSSTFQRLWDNYPTYSRYPSQSGSQPYLGPDSFWHYAGGHVEMNGPIFINTCSLRMCYVLNRSGYPIPRLPGTVSLMPITTGIFHV
jgi:RHS repeat-associated protein